MLNQFENRNRENQLNRGNISLKNVFLMLILGLSLGITAFGQSASQLEKAEELAGQGDTLYFEDKEYSAALDKYNEAIRVAPNYAYAYLAKGWVLEKLNRYDEAIASYNKALEKNYEKPALVYWSIGASYFDRKRYSEAIRFCEKAVQYDNRLYAAYFTLADSYNQLKNYEKALTAINRVVELQPSKSGFHVAKGIVLLNLKRNSEAVNSILKAIELDKENHEAYYWLGYIYKRNGEYQKAENALIRATYLKDDDEKYWEELGSVYFNQKKWKQAIESYQIAISHNPDMATAYFNIGNAYSNLGNSYQAIEAFQAAIKKNIGWKVWTLWRIGTEYKQLGENDKAEKIFDTALQTEPKDVDDYRAKGYIYSNRWMLAESVEWLQKTINFSNDDDDSGSYISLSWDYSFLDDHQSAARAATKAIELAPKEFMGYTNRCRAHNDLNQLDKALADCQTALKLSPDDGETLFYMARTYRLKGNQTMFMNLIKKALPNLQKQAQETDKSSSNYESYNYLLGTTYYYLGKYAEAAQTYEKVLRTRPNFPQAVFNLGLAYINLKNKNAALVQYRKLLAMNLERANKLKADIDKMS